MPFSYNWIFETSQSEWDEKKSPEIGNKEEEEVK